MGDINLNAKQSQRISIGRMRYCIIGRGGGEVRSQVYYWRRWEQEGTDLEGGDDLEKMMWRRQHGGGGGVGSRAVSRSRVAGKGGVEMDTEVRYFGWEKVAPYLS